ncbi:MAG: hypothetical protein FWD74_00880 [Actinomycetia bacterium]|nr:hypothetical protein [Actinomycetes bacterium]
MARPWNTAAEYLYISTGKMSGLDGGQGMLRLDEVTASAGIHPMAVQIGARKYVEKHGVLCETPIPGFRRPRILGLRAASQRVSHKAHGVEFKYDRE